MPQGRLPIRVELRGLTAADFERILTEPECSMIYQQQVRVTADAMAGMLILSDGRLAVYLQPAGVHKEFEQPGLPALVVLSTLKIVCSSVVDVGVPLACLIGGM